MKILVLFLIALSFPLLVLLSLSNDPVERSIEWELAAVNAGEQVSDNDPTIAEFSVVLDRLERKSENSRREIADICIFAYLWFKERGSLETLLEFTHKVDEAIPEKLGTRMDLAKFVRAMMS